MFRTFFPDPAFAWLFCLGLWLLTCLAAYLDTRTTKIPNRLNVLIFATGLVVNIVRGAWMGSESKPLWVFDSGSLWLGAIDGLLFSLVGFAAMFAAMFGFWILGLCGGGDVKLFAAIAAWVGLTFVLLGIWLLSVVALFFWFGASILSRGLTPRTVNSTLDALKNPTRPKVKLRLTYSLPIAAATIIALLWMFRFELQLANHPKPQETTADARPAPEVL